VFRRTYPPFNPGRWDLDAPDPGLWEILWLVYIYLYVQDLRVVYTNRTLSLYRYVCMHASNESSSAAHVSFNARAGAGRCSSNFLFTYVFDGSVYTCIQKCMYSQIVCICLPPILGSLGHALGSLVLFVLQDLLQADFL